MKKNKLILIGSITLFALFVISFVGPFLLNKDISAVDLYNISSPPGGEHLLGTDELGRDVLARLMYGGRISLIVGVIATLLQVIIGVVLGTLAGYFGGITDVIIMKIVDIVMCFPFFIVAIALAAIIGPSIYNLIFIITIYHGRVLQE